MESGGTTPHLLNFSNGWRWVTCFTSPSLHPLGQVVGTHWMWGWGRDLVILLKSVRDFSDVHALAYWGTFKETQTGSVEDVEGETWNEGHWTEKRTGNCNFIHPPLRVVHFLVAGVWGGVAYSVKRFATGWTFGARTRCGQEILSSSYPSRPAVGAHPGSYTMGAGDPFRA